jgi:glycosyltransferase 2 family protein
MFSAYKKYLTAVFFIIGFIVFIFSIRAVGAENLTIVLPVLSPVGLALLLIYPFMSFWDAIGWFFLFPADSRKKILFWKLNGIRLAGEAINNVTPFIDIGGEFLKVDLLASEFGIPKKTAAASVIVGRTVLLFSEIIFWIIGLILAPLAFVIPPEWKAGLYVTIAVFVGLAFLLFIIQKTGVSRLHDSFKGIDEDIAAFYAKNDFRVAFSTFFHLIGWAAGGIEVYFMFRLVGYPVSAIQAALIEAFLQLVRSASFFIPQSLGAQEAGMALLAQGMGFHPSIGVGVSILKRLRQIVWTALGFLLWRVFVGQVRAKNPL